jgi:hypothetical protein
LVVALVEQGGVCRPLEFNLRHPGKNNKDRGLPKIPAVFCFKGCGKTVSPFFIFTIIKTVKINHGADQQNKTRYFKRYDLSFVYLS